MRQLELGWDTNSDRERNAMVTPRHLALASWGGARPWHNAQQQYRSGDAKAKKCIENRRSASSNFGLSFIWRGAMLAEKTKRERRGGCCKLQRGNWVRASDGRWEPFFESFLSLSVRLRLTRNELKFWAWLRMEESEKEEQS